MRPTRAVGPSALAVKEERPQSAVPWWMDRDRPTTVAVTVTTRMMRSRTLNSTRPVVTWRTAWLALLTTRKAGPARTPCHCQSMSAADFSITRASTERLAAVRLADPVARKPRAKTRHCPRCWSCPSAVVSWYWPTWQHHSASSMGHPAPCGGFDTAESTYRTRLSVMLTPTPRHAPCRGSPLC